MNFIKKTLKKETILFLVLLSVFILSIGSISANEISDDVSDNLNMDKGLEDSISTDIDYDSANNLLKSNSAKNILSSDNPNENLNENGSSDEESLLNEESNINPDKDNLKDSSQKIELNEEKIDDVGDKINTTISLKSNTIVKESNLTIYLKDINKKAIPNGNLIININNRTYNRTTDSKGIAYLYLNIPVKTYLTSIYYEGNGTYLTSSLNINVTVNKISTKFAITNRSVVKERNLIIQLLDKNNRAMKNQNVTVTIKNKKYAKTTNSYGRISMKISLDVGKYPVKISYNGNANYSASSKSFNMTVYKIKTRFSLYKSSVISGNNLYAYLKTADGKALSKRKVSLKFNGKSYTKTTDKNGKITFRINEKSGKYKLKLSYGGGSSYQKASQSFTVRSYNIKTKIVVANYSVVRGKYFLITLKDNDNNILKNRGVTFTFYNKKYTKVTNANGQASLRLTKVPGTHSMNIKYNGHKGYLKTNRNIKVRILKNTTAYITANNQTKHLNGNRTVKYYVRLTDNKGNPLANETIKLRVKCLNISVGNGKKINKKTIVLSSDNIVNKTQDRRLLNQMAKILRSKGYTVKIAGIGPNYHVNSVRNYRNVCVFHLVGGVDSGMFVDMSDYYYKSYLRQNNNQFVLGCVAPPVYLNLGNMTWLRRAHDDNYSPKSFRGIYYPGKYFNKRTGLNYVYGSNAEELVYNFIKYGKKGYSVGIDQNIPRTTNTYTVTTGKNGYAYIELCVGTYTLTSYVVNSKYKVDGVTSTLNVIK